VNIYDFRLRPTDEDRFIFDVETSKYWNKNRYSNYLLDELMSRNWDFTPPPFKSSPVC
jgi:hypothetical protein